MGQVIPIEEIGTDRHRLDTWTASAATAFNDHAAGKPWQFKSFRKTNGYVAMPLIGRVAQRAISAQRLRAHADGSPRAAERRPQRFYRAYDVYDPVRVGFVAQGADAQREGEMFDTTKRGSANGGHAYGTALAPD